MARPTHISPPAGHVFTLEPLRKGPASIAVNPTAINVTWRFTGGGYSARAGRGSTACTASSTSRPADACRRAAAKFFGCDDACVTLEPTPPDFGTGGHCKATTKGGA